MDLPNEKTDPSKAIDPTTEQATTQPEPRLTCSECSKPTTTPTCCEVCWRAANEAAAEEEAKRTRLRRTCNECPNETTNPECDECFLVLCDEHEEHRHEMTG